MNRRSNETDIFSNVKVTGNYRCFMQFCFGTLAARFSETIAVLLYPVTSKNTFRKLFINSDIGSLDNYVFRLDDNNLILDVSKLCANYFISNLRYRDCNMSEFSWNRHILCNYFQLRGKVFDTLTTWRVDAGYGGKIGSVRA